MNGCLYNDCAVKITNDSVEEWFDQNYHYSLERTIEMEISVKRSLFDGCTKSLCFAHPSSIPYECDSCFSSCNEKCNSVYGTSYSESCISGCMTSCSQLNDRSDWCHIGAEFECGGVGDMPTCFTPECEPSEECFSAYMTGCVDIPAEAQTTVGPSVDNLFQEACDFKCGDDTLCFDFCLMPCINPPTEPSTTQEPTLDMLCDQACNLRCGVDTICLSTCFPTCVGQATVNEGCMITCDQKCSTGNYDNTECLDVCFQTCLDLPTEKRISPCDDPAHFECPHLAECVDSINSENGYDCKCNSGHYMSGGVCKPVMPFPAKCNERFLQQKLKKLKVKNLKTPTFWSSKVRSQPNFHPTR